METLQIVQIKNVKNAIMQFKIVYNVNKFYQMFFVKNVIITLS